MAGSDESSRTDAAVRAALGVAARLGAGSVQPRLLASYTSVMVHLRPLPVVARVTVAADDGGAAKELAVSSALAARGAPVVPPSDLLAPGPHREDGLVVSLWRLVETTGRPPAEAGGATLRELHEAGESVDVGLAPFDPLAQTASALVRCARRGLLPARDLVVLERAHEQLVAAGAAAALEGDVVLHGDAHLANLLATTEGPLWCDLEDSFRGAPEWDVACLLSRAVIFGDERGARAALAYGPVDQERLDAIVALRALWIAPHSALFAERLGRPSHSLELRMDWLRRRFGR
jgi:hypothetical protein